MARNHAMSRACAILCALIAVGAPRAPAAAQVGDDESGCAACHGTEDLWDEDQQHLYVDLEGLATDLHWVKGIKCQDCHGGNPDTFTPGEAHAAEDGFRDVKSPADLPGFCGHCHSNAEYMRERNPDARTDIVERFRNSAHGQRLRELGERLPAGDPEILGQDSESIAAWAEAGTEVVSCTSCHEKHGMLPKDDPQSLIHPTQTAQACGSCHQTQRDALLVDVHSRAGPKDEQGEGTALACSKCHGDDVHGILPVDDMQSPVFVHNQLEACGKCHEEGLQSYLDSVHGRGLTASGLLTTATCSSCHGAHGVYKADDQRSSLHVTQVAKTCGQCHLFLEQRLEASVHGRGAGPGGLAERAAPGGQSNRKPSCTDCHQGHDLPDPGSADFRMGMADRCGNCHQDLSERYAFSMHGQLTQLGNEAAAKCSDCHGAHDILPIDDPASCLAGENRVETCAQCHPRANVNFARFDPHADHHDPQRSPILYYAFYGMETLLFAVFGFFGVHTLLWFGRSWVHRARHGIPRRLAPGRTSYVRFESIHRTMHLLIIISFLGLALTGLPLKYSSQPWAQWLAAALGGFETTSFWHRICAIITFSYFFTHFVWLGRKVNACRRAEMRWTQILIGPDSPVPNFRDIQDMWVMARWFVGLGPKPTFDRWSYWEKFDYWSVFWGVAIIGASGLMLWFPEFFCRFLPGTAINIAKIIHSEEALLATGFIFSIHFFNTHLRAEKFPMDMSMLTGLVTEEEMADERPEFVARMREAGQLEQLQHVGPTNRALWLTTLGGWIALVIGLALLAGILAGILGG